MRGSSEALLADLALLSSDLGILYASLIPQPSSN